MPSLLDAAPQRARVEAMSRVRSSCFYLPEMLKKNWGRIVFISSAPGINIPAGMTHCGVTKTAQIALAGALAEPTSGTGVMINSVLPGPTCSEDVDQFEEFAEDAEDGPGSRPVGRFLNTPSEKNHAIARFWQLVLSPHSLSRHEEEIPRCTCRIG